MATTRQNTKAFDAKRFAALLAGFDLGNMSEEEAAIKGREMRRMAAKAGMRIVDLMELPDVRKAIDDQMQPARNKDGHLHAALEQAAALREELTERTRDVRKLAELLRGEKEASASRREEWSAMQSKAGQRQRNISPAPAPRRFGLVALIATVLPYLGAVIGYELYRWLSH